MPGHNVPPSDVGALRDLRQRVEDLERRLAQRSDLSVHPSRPQDLNGTGANSSAVAGSNVATYPDAGGTGAVAVGNATEALDADVAIGDGATARSTGGTAIGKDSFVSDHGGPTPSTGIDATAVGTRASSIWDHSASFGADAFTSNVNQIVLGSNLDRTIQAALTTGVPSASDLSQGQMSWHRDESGSQLIVEIKFSSGAVKTGTIALT
jgi:hypothetical protein